MRPTAVLATALFLAPAFAHADTIYNYAGTIYVTGNSDVLHPDGTEDNYIDYNNSPFQVAVAVDLTRGMYEIKASDFHDFADNFYSYLNFPNVGSSFNNVEEVDYNDSTPDGDFDPAPTISLSGIAQSSCPDPPYSDCELHYVSYGGTLPLVTSTPELSTFALLATGLAGVPVALRKRFV